MSFSVPEIENQVKELQAKKVALSREGEDSDGRIPLSASSGVMDEAIYGSAKDKFADYVTSIAANDDNDDDDENVAVSRNGSTSFGGSRINVNAPSSLINDVVDEDHDPLAERRVARIVDRYDEYRAKGLKRKISPERADPFLEGNYALFLIHSYFDAFFFDTFIL